MVIVLDGDEKRFSLADKWKARSQYSWDRSSGGRDLCKFPQSQGYKEFFRQFQKRWKSLKIRPMNGKAKSKMNRNEGSESAGFWCEPDPTRSIILAWRDMVGSLLCLYNEFS